MTNQELLERLKKKGIELISPQNMLHNDYRKCRTSLSWFNRGLIALINSLELDQEQGLLAQKIYGRIGQIHFRYLDANDPSGTSFNDREICWIDMQREFQDLGLEDFG